MGIAAGAELPRTRGEEPALNRSSASLVSSLPAGHSRRRPSGAPPPLPHPLERPGKIALGLLIGISTVWAITLLVDPIERATRGFEGSFMVWVADHRWGPVTAVLDPTYDLLYTWAVPVIGISALLIIAFAIRRLRFAAAFVLALILVVIVVSQAQQFAVRPRPYGIDILSRWEWYSHPLRIEAMLAAVSVAAVLLLAPLGKVRRRATLVAGALLAYMGVAAVYLGSAHPSDVFMAVVIATTVTVLVIRLVAPPKVFPVTYRRGSAAHLDISGNRGLAIRHGIEDQLGYRVLDVEPVGLAGSAGSTPLKLEVLSSDGASHTLFAKLYETTHLRSDRWYKVSRTLMYGQLEDERKFGSVRRLVQAEDYLAYKVTQAGIRTPQCHGIVELTPEREYVLVFDFLDGAVEMGQADIDGEIIDRGIRIVRSLWDYGLAHRDIKPANLMVTADGDVALIDVAFAQVRPSPWRQAVDLANMMLVLALRSDAQTVYRRALLQFTADDIAEAFAASRGITLPSQVRRELKADSRDLLAEFRSMGPARKRVAIQRWSVQRVLFTAWFLFLVFVLTGLSWEFLRVTGIAP